MKIAVKALFATLLALGSVSGVAAQQFQASPFAAAVVPKVTVRTPTAYGWMSPDVAQAWRNNYLGQKTTITVIDDFSSASKYAGKFTATTQTLRHGEWTSLQAGLVAPSATIVLKDFNTGSKAVSLATGLNVLNLSYGMYARAGYSSVGWSAQETSIISYAAGGKAIISKAAGNDAVVVGGTTAAGQVDYLDKALIGAQSAIFVGALDRNGTTSNKAALASYSNSAGTDARVRKQFLVVGVEGSKTGLYGTSFAAPIVAGYAAVIGSKFTTATPTQITNKLLDTARTDTLLNYNPSTYGRGEACLACALAPLSIR